VRIRGAISRRQLREHVDEVVSQKVSGPLDDERHHTSPLGPAHVVGHGIEHGHGLLPRSDLIGQGGIGAGCHDGTPLSVSSPIPVGEALMTPTPFPLK